MAEKVSEFSFTPRSAIFHLYCGGLLIIVSGPDDPMINSMQYWEPMTYVNQDSEPDHPMALVGLYDKQVAF